MAKDGKQSLEDVVQLGFARILTSGQSKSAFAGADCIQELVEKAQHRVWIMPGAGINEENLAYILEKTKAQEFHCSASTWRESGMTYRNAQISMGSNSSDYGWKVSDAAKIKRLIEIANQF